MIPSDKLIGILQRLLDKSRSNQVNWQPGTEGGQFSAFFVKLPRTTIRVSSYSPETEPDYYCVLIENERGDVVGSYTAYENDDEWILLHDLYSEAERYVTGWDHVLHDLELEISKEGPIGLPAGQRG